MTMSTHKPQPNLRGSAKPICCAPSSLTPPSSPGTSINNQSINKANRFPRTGFCGASNQSHEPQSNLRGSAKPICCAPSSLTPPSSPGTLNKFAETSFCGASKQNPASSLLGNSQNERLNLHDLPMDSQQGNTDVNLQLKKTADRATPTSILDCHFTPFSEQTDGLNTWFSKQIKIGLRCPAAFIGSQIYTPCDQIDRVGSGAENEIVVPRNKCALFLGTPAFSGEIQPGPTAELEALRSVCRSTPSCDQIDRVGSGAEITQPNCNAAVAVQSMPARVPTQPNCNAAVAVHPVPARVTKQPNCNAAFAVPSMPARVPTQPGCNAAVAVPSMPARVPTQPNCNAAVAVPSMPARVPTQPNCNARKRILLASPDGNSCRIYRKQTKYLHLVDSAGGCSKGSLQGFAKGHD